jgi:hypothetical protein
MDLQNFTLSNQDEDEGIGQENPVNIVCSFCNALIIPKGNAVKKYKNVRSLINNQIDFIRIN